MYSWIHLHYMAIVRKRKRPVYLNLFQIHFPIGAVVSITHRLSGILLFLLIPVLIYMLEQSVSTPQGYARVIQILDNLAVRIALVMLLWAFAHHLFNGIRQLLIDIDIGVSKEGSRRSSWYVIIAGVMVLSFSAVALL